MSWRLSEFRAGFQREIGSELMQLTSSDEIDAWANEGIERLGFHNVVEADLVWNTGDRLVDLPPDFRGIEKLEPASGESMPSYRVVNQKLRLLTTGGATRGQTVTLIYFAAWPELTGSAASPLPTLGNQGALSWALYRFYKKLASSRSDYRKYATITGANGVDIEELDALSERHFNDFQDARAEVRGFDPAFFHGD